MTQRGSARRWRGTWWFAALAAAVALVLTVVVAACEIPTHADTFSTEFDATTTGCPSGQTLCTADGGAMVCTDRTNDPNNCGSCGNGCEPTFQCSAGVCGCPSGEQVCGGQCTDVLNDPANCKVCGTNCGANGLCNNGECQLYCPVGQTNCDASYCSDLKSDNANCDTCGFPCADNLACDGGVCETCPAADVCPNPDGGVNFCFPLDKDFHHCGDCTHNCDPDYTNACVGGVCACVFPNTLCTAATDSGLPKGTKVCVAQVNSRCGPFCDDCVTTPSIYCKGKVCQYDGGEGVLPPPVLSDSGIQL